MQQDPTGAASIGPSIGIEPMLRTGTSRAKCRSVAVVLGVLVLVVVRVVGEVGLGRLGRCRPGRTHVATKQAGQAAGVPGDQVVNSLPPPRRARRRGPGAAAGAAWWPQSSVSVAIISFRQTVASAPRAPGGEQAAGLDHLEASTSPPVTGTRRSKSRLSASSTRSAALASTRPPPSGPRRTEGP